MHRFTRVLSNSIYNVRRMSTDSLKSRSETLTGHSKNNHEYYIKRSAARAFLRAVDWKDGDFTKPIIAVCAPASKTYSPCNAHFGELGNIIAEQINKQGGRAIVFSTPTINDGMTMGTEGMVDTYDE